MIVSRVDVVVPSNPVLAKFDDWCERHTAGEPCLPKKVIPDLFNVAINKSMSIFRSLGNRKFRNVELRCAEVSEICSDGLE